MANFEAKIGELQVKANKPVVLIAENGLYYEEFNTVRLALAAKEGEWSKYPVGIKVYEFDPTKESWELCNYVEDAINQS